MQRAIPQFGPSLLFGFDQLEGAARGWVLKPSTPPSAAPRARNLDPPLATSALLTEYLAANRGRLGLELRMAPTERAAASTEPWFYELAIHNEEAEQRYFTSPGGFWPMIPPAVRAGLQQGTARLLITNLIEGTARSPLAHLYAYLEAIGVRPGSVGYFCGSTNLRALHDELCVERSIHERIHVAGVPFWEERTYADFLLHGGRYELDAERTATVTELAADAFARRERRAAFLCLNGKGRHHRWALVGLLVRRGLLDRGLVSFRARELEDTVWWPDGSLGAEAKAGADELRARVPLCADEAMLRPSVGTRFSSHLYLQSWLSVVTETLFAGEPAHFCSEKTFRPILHLHPFVILGPPGILGSLRACGYETFSPLVDESYDEMLDPTARLGAVAGEVTRIAAMTPDELGVWYGSLRDRLEHNLCRLLSQRAQSRDVLDAELLTTLAAMQGEPSLEANLHSHAAGNAEPRPTRLRLAELAPDWLGSPLLPAGDGQEALRIAARLWRWKPAAFERARVRPVRVVLGDQEIELELASGAVSTRVHVRPSEQCGRAYCRTSKLAIFYSGTLPHPRFTRLLDRLAKSLEGMGFDDVRAMCQK